MTTNRLRPLALSLAFALVSSAAGCGSPDEGAGENTSADDTAGSGEDRLVADFECTPEQQNTLAWVHLVAAWQTLAAAEAFFQDNVGPNRLEWFGAPTPAFEGTGDVAFILGNMKSLFSEPGFRYLCKPPSDQYCFDHPGAPAYVPSIGFNAPHEVHLCTDRFFTLQFEDIDAISSQSMVGLIAHEVSHIAGTVDIAYGESGARDLAANNPALAVYNADNYRFFVSYDVVNTDDF